MALNHLFQLCEYQHNMGLILIEKNECSARIEELTQGLEEAEEILKREQSARLIAMSEFERREDSLKKALALEKQCVADVCLIFFFCYLFFSINS